MQLYKLTGEIPKEIGALINLQEMALISNDFTGQVPTVIGNMTKLQKLYLGANKLTGKLIISIMVKNHCYFLTNSLISIP